MMEVYLDNSATTKSFTCVAEIMNRVMLEDYGNPSSMHMKGVEAEKYVRVAKEVIARNLKVNAKEILFTSGGTESDNLALIGGNGEQTGGLSSDYDLYRASCNPADNALSGGPGLSGNLSFGG